MRDDANVRLIDPHRDDHGWLAHSTGDLGLAISELEDPLETGRDHPDALLLLANRLLRTGQTRCARPVIDHVMAVDPLTPLTRCMPGFLDAMEGRFEAAIGPYLAQHSPFSRPLAEDAALKPVLEKAKRRWKALATGSSS